MPKITKRSPNTEGDDWNAPRDIKDPGSDLNRPRVINRKKNTKRWCAGHVGRDHQYVLVKQHRQWTWLRADEFACSQCGKKKYTKV